MKLTDAEIGIYYNCRLQLVNFVLFPVFDLNYKIKL